MWASSPSAITTRNTAPVPSISRTTLLPSCAAVSSAKSRWNSAAGTARIYLVPAPDDEVAEVRGALSELPPAVHLRLHERRAPAVHERDHSDAFGHRVAVGFVEALETSAVAPLLARCFDQLVEHGIGEAALVRAARGLEEQAE